MTMEWQPIETAPKDRRVLGFGMVGFDTEPGAGTVRWNSTYEVWHCDPNEASEYMPEDCKLTHWMPLPAPPL